MDSENDWQSRYGIAKKKEDKGHQCGIGRMIGARHSREGGRVRIALGKFQRGSVWRFEPRSTATLTVRGLYADPGRFFTSYPMILVTHEYHLSIISHYIFKARGFSLSLVLLATKLPNTGPIEEAEEE